MKVAIVGAGPAGLSAAIELGRVPGVELAVFEKATELREIGAGIALNENTWRLLAELGVAGQLEEYAQRRPGKIDVQHRDGATGVILATRYGSADAALPPQSRIERAALQAALLSAVPAGLIQLGRGVVSLTPAEGGHRLHFADGSEAGPFALVVGADGIRSRVRTYLHPGHELAYTGKTAFRVLWPLASFSGAVQAELPRHSTFWHTPTTHIYTDVIGSNVEIATRAVIPPDDQVSWGRAVGREHVVPHYGAYCALLRDVLSTPETWSEFALFGGPRLHRVTGPGVVLVGDAGHPLSGAFGSGAAFAFEDAYVLARALGTYGVESGLGVFDDLRGPRYKALYAVLDTNAQRAKDVKARGLGDADEVKETVQAAWGGGHDVYAYRVQDVWREHVARSQRSPAFAGSADPGPIARTAQAQTAAA